MLIIIWMRIITFLTEWRIYIGRAPDRVPPRSLILFPLHRATLFCGIAGILYLKKDASAARTDSAEDIITLFASVPKGGVEKILSRSIVPSQYLGGIEVLEQINACVLLLKQDVQFESFFYHPPRVTRLHTLIAEMNAFLGVEEKRLEECADRFSTEDMEAINSRLVLLKDILWAIEKDLLENVKRIASLRGGDEEAAGLSAQGLHKYKTLNFLLNCLDRIEVRGRDSAGLKISFSLKTPGAVENKLAKLKSSGLYEDFLARTKENDLYNGSIRYVDDRTGKGSVFLSFTYKTASIIGELGENVRKLRESIRTDAIFRIFAEEETDFEASLAHTRWASVGSITEANCHPINNYSLHYENIPPTNVSASAEISPSQSSRKGKCYPRYGEGDWEVSVVLNGDIDNYPQLRQTLESDYRYVIAPELTSDSKIIPLQIEKYLFEENTLAQAFRLAVSDFEGSHAIAMVSNLEPGKIFLALKGSGQSIYVGLCEDKYLFSSEIYGLVEGTDRFIKMDGEKISDAGGSGQIFILDQSSRGGFSGIQASFYDGNPVELTEASIQKAEITTRDIDRGDYPHYFLKEITESTQSVRKTLRGKFRIKTLKNNKSKVVFNLGHDILPEKILNAFRKKRIHRIAVIGQGTAAIAGATIADGLSRYLKGAHIRVEAKKASELSGFAIEDDLSDTLVIAVTQSGTTTDTNRAVAMAAEKNGAIISIVNRRQSDITTKSDGVFYTSDGRDIEMSVASTKAFYSQIVAGYILSLCFAQILKTETDDFIADELLNLEKAPALMSRVLEKQDEIRASAEKIARRKKYWAVVGSGPNKAAADEIRIKLSELCYKTISSDFIEDKKHIDLSSEPLIIVCASGNPETVVGDIIKDVAIFKAHKASVVVFADEDERRFDSIADTVVAVPVAAIPLPVILNTLAGHLWGYYAARSIDEDAAFFREHRNRFTMAIVEQDRKNYSLYERIVDRNLHLMLKEFSARFTQRKNSGNFSLMNARTVSDLWILSKYVAGKLPLEDFWNDFEAEDGVSSPIDLLNISFGRAIDELARPIDAIRHQAKTVTVGTSRKEEALKGFIFDLLLSLRFSAKNLTNQNLLAISRIQKGIADVKGYTLYDIENLDAEGQPTDASTISINKRGGISLQMKSRVETSSALMGTKKTIIRTGTIYAGLGKSDGAAFVLIPLLKGGNGSKNLLLVHVDFRRELSPKEKIEILGERYNDILNLINEYNLSWNDEYLNQMPIEILLGESVEFIATKIRKMLETK